MDEGRLSDLLIDLVYYPLYIVSNYRLMNSLMSFHTWPIIFAVGIVQFFTLWYFIADHMFADSFSRLAFFCRVSFFRTTVSW
jgi:hypothetical protein